jgi:hypothetical protein
MRTLILASVLACAVYGPGVWSHQLVYEDDQMMPVRPVVASDAAQIVKSLATAQPRVLSTATIWGLDAIVPQSARIQHLGNLAFHLLNGWLLYAVAGLWLSSLGAQVAGSLLLLHPANTQAVNYVAARPDLVATAVVLTTIYLAMTYGRLCWVIVLVGCGLAVTAKESAIVVVPLVWWLLIREDTFRKGYVWLFVLPLMGLTICRILTYGELSDQHVMSRGPIGYAALQATLLFEYLSRVIWPVGLSIDHDPEVYTGWYVVLALVSWAALCVAAWRVRRHWPMALTGIGFYLVAIAPRFVVRFSEYVNEHQTYLPLVGIWILIGSAWGSREDA